MLQWAADVVRDNESLAVADNDKRILLEQVGRGTWATEPCEHGSREHGSLHLSTYVMKVPNHALG